MNAMEKCVDMIIAIVILFLLPLLFYSGGCRIVRSVSVGTVCEEFLKRVSTAGEITPPVWRSLEEALEQYGCEQFGVRREYTLWEPGEALGSVTEQRYIEEKEDLSERIRSEGTLSLHKGDSLRVICYMDGFPTVYYDVVRSEGNRK